MSSQTYQKAVKLLARRSHSRKDLEQKLLHQHPPDHVREALDKLEIQGYLNDQRYSEDRFRYLRNHKSWGNLRIASDLKRHGVDAKIVRSTIEKLEEESPEAESLRRVIQRRKMTSGAPHTAAQLKKLFDYCFRLGYPPETIRHELDQDFRSINWEDV